MDVVALLAAALQLANTIASINLKLVSSMSPADAQKWAADQILIQQPIVNLIQLLTPKLPASTTPPAA